MTYHHADNLSIFHYPSILRTINILKSCLLPDPSSAQSRWRTLCFKLSHRPWSLAPARSQTVTLRILYAKDSYGQLTSRVCFLYTFSGGSLSTPVIGTHDGNFHCDEALACAMLRMLPKYSDAYVLRTRKPEVTVGSQSITHRLHMLACYTYVVILSNTRNGNDFLQGIGEVHRRCGCWRRVQLWGTAQAWPAMLKFTEFYSLLD